MKTKEQIEAHRRTCEHLPYLRGKTQEVMVWFTPVEMIVRL